MSEITLLAEVTAFLRQPHGQFIAGHREAGHGAPFAVINPATGEAIAEITAADVGQADRAMESARQAFNQWREMPTLARGALLLKLADTLAEHREELAGRGKSPAKPWMSRCRRWPGRNIPPLPAASRWAWWSASYRGTSRL